MSTPAIETTYPFLQTISGYGQQMAINLTGLSSRITTNSTDITSLKGRATTLETNVETNTTDIATNLTSINNINTKLSTYTKNSDNVTISQKLLGDQVYTITGTTDSKQYVQAQDFLDLKKVVLGVDLVNNFQANLAAIGGMDDSLKVLSQKTDKLTQDDTNNLLKVSVPIQSTSSTQTTSDVKQYVTYYQHKVDQDAQGVINTNDDNRIVALQNKTACITSTSGNNCILAQDLTVGGILKNTSSALVPANANEYVTKYYTDQLNTAQSTTNDNVQQQLQYIVAQVGTANQSVQNLVDVTSGVVQSNTVYDTTINQSKLLVNKNTSETAKLSNHNIQIFGAENSSYKVVIDIVVDSTALIDNQIQYIIKIPKVCTLTNINNFLNRLKTECSVSSQALLTYLDTNVYLALNTILVTASGHFYTISYQQMNSNNNSTGNQFIQYDDVLTKVHVFGQNYVSNSISSTLREFKRQYYIGNNIPVTSHSNSFSTGQYASQKFNYLNQTQQLDWFANIDAQAIFAINVHANQLRYLSLTNQSSRYIKYGIVNQVPTKSILDKVLQLNVVSFIYKPKDKESGKYLTDQECDQNYDKLAKQQVCYGLLAQDVKNSFEFGTNVTKNYDGSVNELDNENEELAINYNQIQIYQLQAFKQAYQEQQQLNQFYKQQISDLQQQLAKIISLNNLQY